MAHRLFPLPAQSPAPEPRSERQAFRAGAFALAVVMLLVGPALWGASKLVDAAGGHVSLPDLPAGGSTPVNSSWQPVFPGADRIQHAVYSASDGHRIEALLVAYRAQRQGAELVSETNSLPGAGFEVERSGTIRSASGAYDEAVVVGPDGRRFVIWSRYYIGQRPFTAPLASQLWYGVRSVAGPPVSSLLALRAECNPSCDRARQVLGPVASTTEPAWR